MNILVIHRWNSDEKFKTKIQKNNESIIDVTFIYWFIDSLIHLVTHETQLKSQLTGAFKWLLNVNLILIGVGVEVEGEVNKEKIKITPINV